MHIVPRYTPLQVFPPLHLCMVDNRRLILVLQWLLTHNPTLRQKLAELRDFVETNLAESAHQQKQAYDQRSNKREFSIDNCVWLSIPTAGKLESRWEGGWKIKSVKSPVTIEITDGRRTKVVHVNRIRHRLPDPSELTSSSPQDTRSHHVNLLGPNIIVHLQNLVTYPPGDILCVVQDNLQTDLD